MLISFVIPAFNASSTIERTLRSVFESSASPDWEIEVLVVDDGSKDSEQLEGVLKKFPMVTLLRHGSNRGMCAGRNTGISASQGDVVVILDADDEMVADWPNVLREILNEWPEQSHVCYAACRNPQGRITSEEPDFRGLLSLSDILNERHSGEYLPLFRGGYIREKKYIDLGMRKSCGIVSYIAFAKDSPFWVSNRVLRIYHDARSGSVTSGWISAQKAAETVQCYERLLDRYDTLYKEYAPRVRSTKCLRLAVYLRMAHLPGAWSAWARGASLRCLKESIGSLLVLLIGQKIGQKIITIVKEYGLVRRYG